MSDPCRIKGCKCQSFEEERLCEAQCPPSDRRKKIDKELRILKPLAIGAGCFVVGALAAPIAVPAALSVIGFTSSGVAASSFAAAMMSSVGIVAKGSAIAVMQSIGAAGLGTTGTLVGATVSGAVGTGVAAVKGKLDESRENKSEDCNCRRVCKHCNHCKCKHVKAC